MKKNILFVLTFLVLFLTSTVTVLAYSNDNLKINGNTKDIWDIYYKNVIVTNGSAYGDVRIVENGSNIIFHANLNKPGDFYEFTVDVVNYGNKDAIIDYVNRTVLTDEETRYLYYDVSYTDLGDIKCGQVLNAGSKFKIRIRLEYKEDIIAEMLPKDDHNVELAFNIKFIEK